jgi:hypothetical protein
MADTGNNTANSLRQISIFFFSTWGIMSQDITYAKS